MTSYVLDATALLAYIYERPGADQVQAALKGGKVYMNTANLGEVYFIIMRDKGKEAAQLALGRVHSSGIEVVPLGEELALRAARLKSFSGIPYVDGLAAATAQHYQAILLTGDPDFKRLEGQVQIEWLPEES